MPGVGNQATRMAIRKQTRNSRLIFTGDAQLGVHRYKQSQHVQKEVAFIRAEHRRVKHAVHQQNSCQTSKPNSSHRMRGTQSHPEQGCNQSSVQEHPNCSVICTKHQKLVMRVPIERCTPFWLADKTADFSMKCAGPMTINWTLSDQFRRYFVVVEPVPNVGKDIYIGTLPFIPGKRKPRSHAFGRREHQRAETCCSQSDPLDFADTKFKSSGNQQCREEQNQTRSSGGKMCHAECAQHCYGTPEKIEPGQS